MLKSCYKNDQKIEAGLDEVGRGSLWGSLVTAAVIWLPEDEWSPDIRELSSQIKDSKKLSEKKPLKSFLSMRTRQYNTLKKYYSSI